MVPIIYSCIINFPVKMWLDIKNNNLSYSWKCILVIVKACLYVNRSTGEAQMWWRFDLQHGSHTRRMEIVSWSPWLLLSNLGFLQMGASTKLLVLYCYATPTSNGSGVSKARVQETENEKCQSYHLKPETGIAYLLVYPIGQTKIVETVNI